MPFEAFLIIGMIAMLLCLIYCGRDYQITGWKVIIIAVSLTVIGYVGAHLMAFVEIGNWGGRSYYGAVFLVPVLMWPIAKMLRLQYTDVMDISAPNGCIMLIILKIKCKIDGCCYGRFFYPSEGIKIQFPSQIVEGVAAAILAGVLIRMIKKGNRRGSIYCWYLILYGSTRFVLNFFREIVPWIGPFAAGTFWSIVSVILGIGSLYLVRNRKVKEN